MSGSSLKANARRLIRENTPRLFFVSMLYLLLVTVLSELSFRLPGNIDAQNMYERLANGELPNITLLYSEFRPAGALLSVLLSLIRPVFDIGLMSYCLKIGRDQSADYYDLMNGFQVFLKVIAIFVVTTVFIALWSIMFIIPGIVAAYRYRLSYYILLDDPAKGVYQCIKESSSMIRGAKLDLFIIDVTFLGWYVLDAAMLYFSPLPFALHIVYIWLAPYRGLTNAGFYEYRRSSLMV